MAATAPSACRKGHLVAGVMPNTCTVAAIRALGQSLKELPSTLEWQQPRLLLAARVTLLQV